MNILLTGATGFIGKNFIKTSLSYGNKIFAIYRDEKKIFKIKNTDSLIWINSRLEDFEISKIKNLKIDTLVHLASHSANHPYDSIEKCIDVNVVSSLRFIDKVYNYGIRNFFIAGTGFEYGLSCNLYDKTPTSACLQPIGSYPVSKAIFSMTLKEWSRDKFDISLIYARIFHIYGEGEKESRLWPSLKKASTANSDYTIKNPSIKIDFTDVELICEMIHTDIKKHFNSKKIIYKNLGSGNIMSTFDFALYWWKKWNSKGTLKSESNSGANETNSILRFVPKIEN